MEVTGKAHYISATQQVNTSFQKRELVVATDEQYPQLISINFVQDKCDLLNSYKVGEQVKVSINLRGREWVNPAGETKYFNDIQGWRIEKVSGKSENKPAKSFAATTDFKGEEQDDLPF
jgi:hypothetical protein